MIRERDWFDAVIDYVGFTTLVGGAILIGVMLASCGSTAFKRTAPPEPLPVPCVEVGTRIADVVCPDGLVCVYPY